MYHVIIIIIAIPYNVVAAFVYDKSSVADTVACTAATAKTDAGALSSSSVSKYY